LLGARGDEDLAALVGEGVVTLELRDDGVLELRGPVHRGVARDALANGLDARICDMDGSVEIRLAGPEADDVLAFGLELCSPGGDGQGGGRFDLLYAL